MCSTKPQKLSFEYDLRNNELTAIWPDGILRVKHSEVPKGLLSEMKDLINPTKFYFHNVFAQYHWVLVEKRQYATH